MSWQAHLLNLHHYFIEFWPAMAAVLGVSMAVTTTLHIVFNKRDPRAAAAWTGLVWLVPFVGVLLYLMLGINRIRRRARQLTGGELELISGWRLAAEPVPAAVSLRSLAQLVREVTALPLTGGNAFRALESAEALAVMARAIREAKESVYLCTYIFGNDSAGHAIIDALTEAHERGVRVRVLIDGVGALYSFPTVVSRLRRANLKFARFLHSLAPWRMPYMNLRNHRKLLIIDQRLGFTGGMNIRDVYLGTRPSTRDLHFMIQGPVVGHLARVFASDWQFSTGEILDHAYRGPAVVGNVLARGISTGPDADFDKRRLTLLGAVGRAEHEIRIATPYFVPDQSLMTALELARLRGVRVQLVVPEQNNLRFVHWASLHMLRWALDDGFEVWLSPPPFDHSKLMTVDGAWGMIGSGNWDARSLRLNFEFDVECYGEEWVARLNDLLDQRLTLAQRLCRERLDGLPGWARVRNALAYLLEPYL